MKNLVIIILATITFASCKKDKTEPTPDKNTVVMPQPTYTAPAIIDISSRCQCFNAMQQWDSASLGNQLAGSWLWVQSYELSDSAKYETIPVAQSRLIKFNNDQTVDIYVNGKLQQTSNWKMVVDYAPNYWKLEIDNYDELSSCVFVFCENTMLFISREQNKDHTLFEKVQ